MPHIRIAAQMSSAPGTTGTTTPTNPTAMPSATSTSTPVIAGSFAWEAGDSSIVTDQRLDSNGTAIRERWLRDR